MKIALAQLQPTKGNIAKNIEKHLHLIELAVAEKADLIVFPELSITGYEPDLAAALATQVDDEQLAVFQQKSNAHKMTIGIGIPLKKDKGVCISLVFFHPNQPPQIYFKKYLHADEMPFFIAGVNETVFIRNTKIALAICYEVFVDKHLENTINEAEMYLASVAKSEKGVQKAYKRLSFIAQQYRIPVLMVNCTGFCDNFKAIGQSAIWNETGQLLRQLDTTTEGIICQKYSNHSHFNDPK